MGKFFQQSEFSQGVLDALTEIRNQLATQIKINEVTSQRIATLSALMAEKGEGPRLMTCCGMPPVMTQRTLGNNDLYGFYCQRRCGRSSGEVASLSEAASAWNNLQ